jgi:hypothetical protein
MADVGAGVEGDAHVSKYVRCDYLCRLIVIYKGNSGRSPSKSEMQFTHACCRKEGGVRAVQLPFL